MRRTARLWRLLGAIAGGLSTLSATAGEVVKSPGERVTICFNYGCLSTATMHYDEARLRQIRNLLHGAQGAAEERARLAEAIGRLLGWAGEQTPIAADRGGNYADDGVYGKMDCIDHSTTTTRLLRMLERRGALRWHRVLEPEVRTRLIFDHWTAVIEEVPRSPYRDDSPLAQPRFAVDSWFNDNGRPAVIQPLDDWKDWEGPRGK